MAPLEGRAVRPPQPGRDPLQRWLVAFALALVAAILAATLAGCGGGTADEDEPRAAIPAQPASGASI